MARRAQGPPLRYPRLASRASVCCVLSKTRPALPCEAGDKLQGLARDQRGRCPQKTIGYLVEVAGQLARRDTDDPDPAPASQ